MLYPGGKGNCFRHIINLMPPHRVYIETHLGGGNVLERKKPAALNIGVDIDAGLIHRWQQRAAPLGPIAADSDNRGHRQQRRGDPGAPQYRFIHRDALEYLTEYQWQGGELVYCDPPYVMSTKSGAIYKHEYTDLEHLELLNVLNQLPCYVMVSGYQCGLYESMLGSWHLETFTNSTRGGQVTEYLWLNFTPNGVLHDYSYVGDNFREREKIKRKKQRWLSRIKAMPAAERNCIAEAIEAISKETRPTPAELAMPAVSMAATSKMASVLKPIQPATPSNIAILDPNQKPRG